MATLFWVGGSTAYDGVTNRLATTSGGAATVAAITAADTVTFDASSPAAAVVTTSAAISCTTLTLNGFTGSLTMSNNLTVSGVLTHTTGTLALGSGTHSFGSYNQNAGTRTLSPGTSSINCNTWLVRNAGTTISANTATLTMSGSNSSFDANSLCGVNYNGMNLVQSGSGLSALGISNSSAFTLGSYTRTGTATKVDGVTLAPNITITGAITLNGNSLTNRISVFSVTVGISTALSAGSVGSSANVDFQDITFTGAGAPFTGTSLGNALGNSGITFTTPVTRYGVVAGNFSSTATWSTTSGGSGGASVPICHDTIILDASSAAGTYTNDMPRPCADINCTGFTRTLAFAGVNCIYYGSITLSAGMTFTQSSAIVLQGRSPMTITSAGKSWNNLTFNSIGGGYTFQDAFANVGTITLTNGGIDTNGFSVTSTTFVSTAVNVRALTLGTTTWSLTQATASTPWNVVTTNLTFSGASSTIVISTTSASARSFAGGGLLYGTFTHTVAGSAGAVTITGANYFDTFNFSDATNARSVLFNAAVTNTIKNFNVQGTSGKLMTVTSTSGTNAFLEIVGAPPVIDYVNFTTIFSTTPYKLYSGTNGVDGGGNNNIIFTALVTQPYINMTARATATGTSQLATFPFSQSATAGNLLLYFVSCPTTPTVMTPPTGFTLIDSSFSGSNGQLYTFYKVAAGGETSAASTSTSSISGWYAELQEIAGFTGTPTLDVKDKNNTGGANATSLSTGAGVTNTLNPAYAVAGWSASAGIGANVSITNSFQESRGVTIGTNARMYAKPLTALASQTTTLTWTTTRIAASQLVIFGGVPAVASSASYRMMTGMGL